MSRTMSALALAALFLATLVPPAAVADTEDPFVVLPDLWPVGTSFLADGAGGLFASSREGVFHVDAMGGRTPLGFATYGHLMARTADGAFIVQHDVLRKVGPEGTEPVWYGAGWATFGPDGRLYALTQEGLVAIDSMRDMEVLVEGRFTSKVTLPDGDIVLSEGRQLHLYDLETAQTTHLGNMSWSVPREADALGRILGVISLDGSTRIVRMVPGDEVAATVGEVPGTFYPVAYSANHLWLVQYMNGGAQRLARFEMDTPGAAPFVPALTLPPAPDLVVAEFRVERIPAPLYERLDEGDLHRRVFVTIANVGPGDADRSFGMELYVRQVPLAADSGIHRELGAPAWFAPVEGLPAGESVELMFEWETTLRAGTYNFTALVDVSPFVPHRDHVLEIDDHNNVGWHDEHVRVQTWPLV